MKKYFVFLLLQFVLCTVTTPVFAILVETGTAAELAMSAIGDNIIAGNFNFQYNQKSAGLYSDAFIEAGENDLLFDGLVLSTGDVFALNNNYNTSSETSNILGLPRDSDLLELVPNGLKGYDASYIEFDIVPTITGNMYFSYLLGSDEYFYPDDPLYERYIDVLGIFVNEQNIAVIPGTEVPVSINTINEHYNSEYFNDNNKDHPMYATEMDGFTDVFTAALPVIEGETYHIKFGVTDIRDPKYDTWALFGERSLRVEPVSVYEPGLKSMIAVLIIFIAIMIFSDKKYRILRHGGKL